MASSENGELIVSELGMNEFTEAVDSDWDDVRALSIK